MDSQILIILLENSQRLQLSIGFVLLLGKVFNFLLQVCHLLSQITALIWVLIIRSRLCIYNRYLRE